MDVDAKIEQCRIGWRNIVRDALAKGSRWFYLDEVYLPHILPPCTQPAADRYTDAMGRSCTALLSLEEETHLAVAESFIRDAAEKLASIELARTASPFPGLGGKA